MKKENRKVLKPSVRPSSQRNTQRQHDDTNYDKISRVHREQNVLAAPVCKTTKDLLPTVLSRKALHVLPRVLDTVMPLKRAHRSDLPHAVRDLSTLLTSERSGLNRSYWSAPRFVSAYLRHFLPWNLIRLSRLLYTLELPNPTALPPGILPVFTDLGSGPLSLPMALWLTQPEWRAQKIQLFCIDTSPRPMELGRLIFEQLAEALQEPLHWNIRLIRSPFAKALREVQTPLLITAGNVLNEWSSQKTSEENTTLHDRLAELALTVRHVLPKQGRALFVEPGTRLGGTLTATLREAGLEEGLHPISPCTHVAACPLLGHRDRGWCHSHQEIENTAAPDYLVQLGRLARLSKKSLSLSHVFLRPTASAEEIQQPTKNQEKTVEVRIISDPFLVPNMGHARYGCCKFGLVILPRARAYASGECVQCLIPPKPRYDEKSGALELTIAH